MISKTNIEDNMKLINKNTISTIDEYIKVVTEEMQKYNGKIIVFRGEDETFDKPCRPNIFRRESLILDSCFEKKLLDSIRQNGLSNDKSYLYNAIDAQHGTFPSRLLDVTYNSLVALYFAVTPFYHYEEEKNDTKDGAVYVFSFDRAYSPSSENIQDSFDRMIKREDSLLCNNILFSKNHKFIDHCKINKRIMAQQGAFILFQGDDSEGLPAYSYSAIKIPAIYKKKFRQDLNSLFGIHTGYIYPEIDNLVNDLSAKCKSIETKKITFDSEIEDIERQIKQEIDYYIDKTYSLERTNTHEGTYLFRIIEKVIYSYYIGILQLKEYCYKEIEDEEAKKKAIKRIEDLETRYNLLIDDLNAKSMIIDSIKDYADYSSLKIE